MAPAKRPPRLVAVMGSQEFFAERAIAAFEAGWRAQGCELRALSAAAEGLLNDLVNASSPDLFGGTPAIVLRSFEHLGEADGNAVLDQIDETRDVAWLVAHAGGRGSTKVKARLDKMADETVKAEALKGRAVAEFVQQEFRSTGKTVDEETIGLLVDAIGNEPRGLASAVGQLSRDIEDRHIGRAAAAQYYSGHVEVKGYEIADAVANRDVPAAMEALRFALAEGGTRAGLMTVTALSGTFRRLAVAKSAGGGSASAEVASVLRIPEWMARTAVKQSHRWTSDEIADAVATLAELSVAMKGGVEPEQALTDEQKAYVLQQSISTMAGKHD